MTSRLTAKPEGTFFECANCDHAGPMTELMPIEDLVPLLVAEFDACLEANQ